MKKILLATITFALLCFSGNTLSAQTKTKQLAKISAGRAYVYEDTDTQTQNILSISVLLKDDRYPSLSELFGLIFDNKNNALEFFQYVVDQLEEFDGDGTIHLYKNGYQISLSKSTGTKYATIHDKGSGAYCKTHKGLITSIIKGISKSK